jgi:hypothetical protein
VLAPEYKPENAVFAEKNAFSGRKVAKRSEKPRLSAGKPGSGLAAMRPGQRSALSGLIRTANAVR